jgi:hypothetical protein
VADLRQRAALFEEALQAEPVQGLLVGLDAAASAPPAERSASEDGRYSLSATRWRSFVFGEVDDAKAAGREPIS